MAMDIDILEFLRWTALQSPVLLVYIAGITLAVRRWHRHPRVSLLVILGLGSLLALNLIMSVAYQVLPHLLFGKFAWAAPEVNRLFLIMGLAQSVMAAGAWTLILAAIFSRRNEPDWYGPYTEQERGGIHHS